MKKYKTYTKISTEQEIITELLKTISKLEDVTLSPAYNSLLEKYQVHAQRATFLYNITTFGYPKIEEYPAYKTYHTYHSIEQKLIYFKHSIKKINLWRFFNS